MINIQDIKEDVFSNNNEIFDYENQPECFVFDRELGAGDIFYAGIVKPITHDEFFSVDDLIERLQENACNSDYDEWAEDYLDEVTNESKQALEKGISELLNKHLPKVNFYRVVDSVKYRIVTIDDDKNVFVEAVR